MSKGRKLWLQPGFISNQVVPDYERERNERVKRNNEVLNSLGLKSIATSLWGSAQHKRANDNGKHSKDELDDDYRPPDVENVHAYDSDIDLSLPKRSKSESSPSALVSSNYNYNYNHSMSIILFVLIICSCKHEGKKCRILDVEADSEPNKSANVSRPQPQSTPTHSHSASQPTHSHNASHPLVSHVSSQPTPPPSASQPSRPQPQPVQLQIVQPQHGQRQLIQPQPAQRQPIQPQPIQPQPAQPQPIQPQEQDNFELEDNIDDEIFNEVEVGIRDESNIRTKRGITRLSDIWNLPPGKKVVVDFNATCLPVGEEGGVFNRFIGTVARKPHLCPINCKSWHFVPNHYKEDCWSIIESKFYIPDNERDLIKHNTLKSLGEKLRAWRCSLKAKYYDESKTAAQVVATAPATVNQEQYADLVSYWYSTDGQVLSIANKSRRKEKNNPHTAGSKTYAQHAYELEKREEVGVSRTMLYEPTHTKKDGKTPVSDKAAENMVQDIANGILNQVSPRANQGSSFASHEIEAPLAVSRQMLMLASCNRGMFQWSFYYSWSRSDWAETIGFCPVLRLPKFCCSFSLRDDQASVLDDDKSWH
ncbi:hypothetical protein RHGRI_027034 [Rhododendron griersonianum]|uniref:Transposase n=1 Tax=Rhododendron griersonianum TaxID=479676 RepID=A0AAV6IYE3_9ERIC|nr:hypothetical protein RHGRI_027034 [Rhododendron griersonianum]